MQISAGIVIIQDNKIGLVKPRGLNTGFFSIPKGLVNSGESIVEAAIRETKEETGLVIPKELIEKSVPNILSYVSIKGHLTKVVYYFVVRIDNLIIEKTEEFDKTEIESFNFYERNQAESLIYWKQLSVLNHIYSNRFSLKELIILESLNIITKVKHPIYPIFLYNYTDKCKKTGFWNDTTLWCRGLVLDVNGFVIARPFKKFFEEYQLYSEFCPKSAPTKIFEKLDGALGILFIYKGKVIFCTRQNFKSNQAYKASQIFYKKYSNELNQLNHKYTYLFEIIYPRSRFITDYGETEDIFLLDVINNESGISVSTNNSFSKVNELKYLKESDKKNEGGILIFSNNFKIKIKYDHYKKLYKDLALLKREIVDESKYIESISKINREIPVYFIYPYKIYKQKYLKLYIQIYKAHKELKESERLQLIKNRSVFPG